MTATSVNYIDGKFIETQESKVSILDLGLLRGFGVFDFVRTYNRKPFLLKQHIDRLFSSANQAGFEYKFTEEEISQVISILINRNNFNEYTFRIIITAGETNDGLHFVDFGTKLYVLVTELKEPPARIYNLGVKLITQNFLREFPTIKSLNYFNLLMNQKKIQDSNAFTLLYTYKGKVLEAAISNVFVIIENKIITPRNNILIGTTRNLVMELLDNNYKVLERDITVEELQSSTEVFITGTTQGVVPVVQIDNKKYSKGKPGEITRNIINIFNKYVYEKSK